MGVDVGVGVGLGVEDGGGVEDEDGEGVGVDVGVGVGLGVEDGGGVEDEYNIEPEDTISRAVCAEPKVIKIVLDPIIAIIKSERYTVLFIKSRTATLTPTEYIAY